MNTYQRMREENEQALKTMAKLEEILNANHHCWNLTCGLIYDEVQSFWAAYGRLNCPRSKNGQVK